MSFSTLLIGLSAAAGVGYVFLLERPPGALRTLVKTLAVAALAALAYLRDAPTGLVVALALSAAGDAFLAGDPDRWLPLGLGAFLLAHVAYVWQFLHDGGGRAALAAEPVRAGGVIMAFAAGIMMLAWLWRSLGALRPAVAVYALALSAMVAAAFTLPKFLAPAMAGAVMFMASDAILSAELFKGLRSRLSTHAVWGLYYGAQAAIAYAYLR
ncbi:lysoplasmalogenase [Phenylobacterium montanum]|uniref:Lysoplasmalogenase n=1 Tax=Phenylobacterium montanum TaxID=2823693 RepID=A0A975FXR1_9CAUL|nr:lysoplasmalogenase [Caulobacter sp. S6]QUD86872.1 lysoplasmalogenase [Caulobacter sp. S6]